MSCQVWTGVKKESVQSAPHPYCQHSCPRWAHFPSSCGHRSSAHRTLVASSVVGRSRPRGGIGAGPLDARPRGDARGAGRPVPPRRTSDRDSLDTDKRVRSCRPRCWLAPVCDDGGRDAAPDRSLGTPVRGVPRWLLLPHLPARRPTDLLRGYTPGVVTAVGVVVPVSAYLYRVLFETGVLDCRLAILTALLGIVVFFPAVLGAYRLASLRSYQRRPNAYVLICREWWSGII